VAVVVVVAGGAGNRPKSGGMEIMGAEYEINIC
jgi:hypothetical protein